MDRVQGIFLFVRIVETGSFSKAAEDLGITQPTATKFVASLEKRLAPVVLLLLRLASSTTKSARSSLKKLMRPMISPH